MFEGAMTAQALDASRVLETLEQLGRRVEERFPGSGLGRVSRDLASAGRASVELAASLARPIHWLRAAVATVVAGGILALVLGLRSIELTPDIDRYSVLLQAIESAVNDVVFVAVGIFFLTTLESRVKRGRALRSLHALRSLAHVIDMHQLTKDPEVVLSPPLRTPSSPVRTLSRYELVRYLDYCTELLAITSKLAALHAQHMADAVVLEAVNDVESLANALSAKIWQKIIILDVASAPASLRLPSA